MNSISVLLIEDNPADADLTREAFEANKQPVQLQVAMDGVEALDVLHKRAGHADAREPDLVLLDLNLPRKDGRQVLAEIKSSAELRKIPVVVLSSSEDLKDVLQSYELGANSYISKPVDFLGFQHTLRALNCFWFGTARLPSKAPRKNWTDDRNDAC